MVMVVQGCTERLNVLSNLMLVDAGSDLVPREGGD